jgi:uncharacterized protein (TIGR00730 family)
VVPRIVKSVCVFCGSRSGADPSLVAAATVMGRAIAARGLTLVYGGAKIGIMGAVANGALAGGGRVVGVIPKGLVTKEVAHEGLTELFLTDTMSERKDRMVTLSDAFIALPGGFGTYDELFETITLAQLGIQDKRSGLLNTNGFFDPFVALFRHTIAQGFAAPEHADIIVVDDEPNRLLDGLSAPRAPR